MNTYRVTLRAFGTTGVLLAASLAMLATVSALVAFDGWPRGNGSNGVDQVAVSGTAGPSALVVHAVRQAKAGAAPARATPAPAGFVKTAGPAPASARFTTGLVKTVGPIGSPAFGPVTFSPNPAPVVGPCPPGECGGQPSSPAPPTTPNLIPEPIRHTACGAAASVCGVAQGTLGVTSGPPVPSGSPPGEPQITPQAPVSTPVQAPVQVPVQAPAPVPGG